MTQEVMENLQMEVKHRLIDFLKAEKLPYYEPSLTACPHCGRQAGIIGDFMWSCNECGSKGDVVDYSKERNFFKTRSDALKHVCRVLGIKICHLDTISADELHGSSFVHPVKILKRLVQRRADEAEQGLPGRDFNSHLLQGILDTLGDAKARIGQGAVQVE